MTKHPHVIPYGRALSSEDLKLVTELRKRFNNHNVPSIPRRYDTDFNLMRWILTAQRQTKSREVIDLAEKNLRNHIRFRNALELDEAGVVPTWEENPLFKNGYFPYGQVLTATDSHNRLLWFIEYRSLNLDGLVHILKTSDMIRFQFWQYDYMLLRVMEQEEKTGKMSGIRHVVDLNGFHINPFMMLFVTGGNVAYYSHLFHYEHYPDLVTPTDIVNAGGWITIPYRIVKGMMPAGFSQRFRLHGSDFLNELTTEIPMTNIPQTLGGDGMEQTCTSARVIGDGEYWAAGENEPTEDDLHHLVVNPRRRKVVPVEVLRPATKLSWYFTTDGDLFFGIYKQQSASSAVEIEEKHVHHTEQQDAMQLIYPYMKLAARLVPESDSVVCKEPGTYVLIFCNRASWISRRNVKIQVKVEHQTDRYALERTMSM